MKLEQLMTPENTSYFNSIKWHQSQQSNPDIQQPFPISYAKNSGFVISTLIPSTGFRKMITGPTVNTMFLQVADGTPFVQLYQKKKVIKATTFRGNFFSLPKYKNSL